MNLADMAVSVVKAEATTVNMDVDEFVIYALAKLTELAKSKDVATVRAQIAEIQKASAIARAKTRELQAALNSGDTGPLGSVQAVVIQSDAQQTASTPQPVAQPPGTGAVQNPAALNSVGAALATNGSTELPSQPTPTTAPVVNPEALNATTGFTTATPAASGSPAEGQSAVVMNPGALDSVRKTDGEVVEPPAPVAEGDNALDPKSWEGKGFASVVNE